MLPPLLFFFSFWQTSFWLTRAQHQQWVLLHPQQVRNKTEMGMITGEKESFCRLHHSTAPWKGKQSCGSVHKNRTDKKGQKWWLMVSFNIISDLFSPFTLLFHTSSLFTFCKDLELDLLNNIRGPQGVCCYPWTAPSSLKSELRWEGREPR